MCLVNEKNILLIKKEVTSGAVLGYRRVGAVTPGSRVHALGGGLGRCTQEIVV